MPEVRRGVALIGLLATLLLVGACGSTTTSGHLHVTELANARSGELSLTGGWILEPEGAGSDMATMPGMDHGAAPMVAAYGVLHNSGAKAEALTAVIAPGGAHAQLHVTKQGASSGTMVQVATLNIPAGGARTLAPGGAHVMITGLKPVPKAGNSVSLTFVFRGGTRITAEMPVIAPSDRPSS